MLEGEVMRVAAIFLFCPLLSGCMALAYPTISRTPPIEVDEPDVQAFRVVNHFEVDTSLPAVPGLALDYQTSEMLPRTGSTLGSQGDSSFNYVCLALLAAKGHSQWLEVRLYRRGYQTVCIPAVSWLWCLDHVARPKWEKLEKLEDLETAIEKIEPSPSPSLCSPDASQEMRHFIAQEYRWLAQSGWAAGADREKDRQRLLDKAKVYEGRADYPTSSGTGR
jgi:hypothetical protein